MWVSWIDPFQCRDSLPKVLVGAAVVKLAKEAESIYVGGNDGNKTKC